MLETIQKRVSNVPCCGPRTRDATIKVEDGTKTDQKKPPPRRNITRKPQAELAPRLHAKPKPVAAGQNRDAGGDSSMWEIKEVRYGGAYTFASMGQKEVCEEEVAKGLAKFKEAPHKYFAFWFQVDMGESWYPAAQQQYTLLHRAGTKGFELQNVSDDGPWKCLTAQYNTLPPLEDLGQSKDAYTDQFSYQGYQCAAAAKPGRGDGVGDFPGLKLWGDIDPGDISQGVVGDCWLLSGISSLAEFDGAVQRLFRKTKGLDPLKMPFETPNSYTVTLWDLTSWTEVDVVVDERLARKPDGSDLLGCRISTGGELWAAYVEKAVAAHAGGWDKIDGGQCTHAWSLLTGCKAQYTIRRDRESGTYSCFGKFNPSKREWEAHANSPHDDPQRIWPMEWPAVGGGGGLDLALGEDELFERMCAWDDRNFILAAGTRSGSDTNMTDGIVDGHAYSVLTYRDSVAGTEIDLIKVRNPWGRGEHGGEFPHGEFKG